MAKKQRVVTDPKGLLNPDDYTHYQVQRRRINDTYNLGLPQNKWQRSLVRNEYARDKGDLSRQFAEMREQLPGGYAGRGLLNSGIYHRGLADLAGDRSRAFGRLRGGFEDQTFGLDLARQQLGQVRTNARSDIDDMEAARRAAVAASLRAATGG